MLISCGLDSFFIFVVEKMLVDVFNSGWVDGIGLYGGCGWIVKFKRSVFV